MTIGNVLSQMGFGSKQVSERYSGYHSGPPNDQFLHYAYDAPVTHSHVAASKHNYGGHKNNAAMSALTLLAFLFFLNILQQCLKDHMTSMSTPQFMVMTAGREGEESLAKITEKRKMDKSGLPKNDPDVIKNKILSVKNSDNKNVGNIRNATKSKNINDKILTKVYTSEPVPKRPKTYNNQSLGFPGFVNAMYSIDDFSSS